jgi:hypothetical protein
MTKKKNFVVFSRPIGLRGKKKSPRQFRTQWFIGDAKGTDMIKKAFIKEVFDRRNADIKNVYLKLGLSAIGT